MKRALMVLVAVALLAGSSQAVLNIKLTADQTTLVRDQVTTIRVWAQGTTSGIGSLGGNIVTSGAQILECVPGTFQWVPEFTSPAPFSSTNGTCGPNGGHNGIGSQQPNYLAPDPNYGKADYVQVGHYLVREVGMNQNIYGFVTLSWQSGTYGGFRPVETNKSTVIGTLTSVTLNNLPEPATLAMLAMGGVLAIRRRR